MHFDHFRRETKLFNIADLFINPVPLLKCVLLCVACHGEKTLIKIEFAALRA